MEIYLIPGIFKCSRGIGKNCKSVGKLSRYSSPIILQHYPMYRESDESCAEHDSLKMEKFRETWEVLSQESTDLIGELLEPRLAFSGHSHDYCLLKNRLKIDEYTIPSFSWRNRNNPAFALVRKCLVFREKTVIEFLFPFRVLSRRRTIPCRCATCQRSRP